MLAFPPDISFVYQIVSFVILFAGLKHLIFDPMLRVIEERERRTTGAKRVAADLRSDSDRQAAEYEAKMQQVRLELSASTDSARAVIATEERGIVGAARTQTAAELSELRVRLARQSEEARPQLGRDARDLAGQMFERVVGRPAA